MKLIAFALLSVTSFSVLAQSMDADIRRKIDRLSSMANRGEVERLSYNEKIELNESLAQSLRILRDIDDRRPIPTRPLPRPGRRFDSQATILVGDHVGKTAVITIGGRNPGDILSQCSMELPRLGFTIYSDIIMTSNNEPYEKMRIFTQDVSSVCSQIVNRMRPGRADWQFIDVSGTVTDHVNKVAPLNLAGDRGEVLEQCEGQMKATRFTIFSKLLVSVNRSPLTEKRIFAQGAGKACDALTDIINQKSP